ncbi:MAG TPA: hypothetical protein VII92_08275 [Anaerolineae bacterium]
MTGRGKLHAELDALKSEIKRSASGHDFEKTMRSESPCAEPSIHPDVDRMLRELQVRLVEVTEGVDEAIAAHPLASVGAAFLLGITVGRLTKRM